MKVPISILFQKYERQTIKQKRLKGDDWVDRQAGQQTDRYIEVRKA